MKTIMKLQTIPDTLNVTELMGVKGGDSGQDQCYSTSDTTTKCPGKSASVIIICTKKKKKKNTCTTGAVYCPVENSGVKCETAAI